MNYNYEPIMSWIMYVKTGLWEVSAIDKCVENPDVIIEKFEELFKNEIVRECNDYVHSMFNVHKRFGPITLHINTNLMRYIVFDNYNNLMSFYNGIYKEFSGCKLCLDTKGHGFPDGEHRYFKYCKEEDDRYVSIRSIVEGTCKNNSQNVRRMISILFTRNFRCIEDTNVEQKLFMDYTDEEKETIFNECMNYDEKDRSRNKDIVDLD